MNIIENSAYICSTYGTVASCYENCVKIICMLKNFNSFKFNHIYKPQLLPGALPLLEWEVEALHQCKLLVLNVKRYFVMYIVVN